MPKPSAEPVKASAPPPAKRSVVAETPHPAPAAEASPGQVRVQFGAFTIEDNAHRIQWAVEATGMAVEVSHQPSPKGRMYYYVRSQPFADRAAAISAAAAAQEKAKSFVNPVAIDYIVVSDAATAPAVQAAGR